jgi:hypothetical protein
LPRSGAGVNPREVSRTRAGRATFGQSSSVCEHQRVEQSSERIQRIAVLALIAVVGVVFAASYVAIVRPHPSGLEEMGVHFVGIGLLLVAAWMAFVGYGLWRRWVWAQVAALLTFGPMAVVSLFLSIDVVRRMQQISAQPAPPVHLVAPAMITICAGAITALVASGVRRGREESANSVGVQ